MRKPLNNCSNEAELDFPDRTKTRIKKRANEVEEQVYDTNEKKKPKVNTLHSDWDKLELLKETIAYRHESEI